MEQFWMRLRTSLWWFLGTIIVLLVVILFFWSLIDHEGYVRIVNGFLHDLWEIVKTIIAISLVIVGICYMFKLGPFRSGKKKH